MENQENPQDPEPEAPETLEPPLLPYQLAELLSVKEQVLDAMRKRGEGPPFLELHGKGKAVRIRYPRAGVRRWLNGQPAGTGEPGTRAAARSSPP